MTSRVPNSPGAEGREVKRIRDLVRENAIPEGFRTFELEFGEDSTGDPAVWVWFSIDADYPTDADSIHTLTRLRQRVSSALLRAQTRRIPYVRFREKSAVAG